MRLLHTSDWHLGQSLHNYDRTYEHQCFLDWLLATMVQEEADALLIAGDVFDNANPSAASQRQLYRFLQQARARMPDLDIVIVAGNHDSPSRLEAPAPLLEGHATSVIGTVPRLPDGGIDLERMLVPLRGKDGAVTVWCLAVPFLRPGDVPRLPDDAPEGTDPYLGGIALLYRQLLDMARARRTDGQSIVAMGHCHMVNGQSSQDSERRIVIGGTEALPATVFDDDVAYAALGHLHLAQRIGQREALRYCGSPLPMSFSETGYQHQVLRIDLAGGRAREVTPLHVPRAVQMLRVPSQPAAIDDVLAALESLQVDEAAPECHPYLEVRVLLDGPDPGLRARVEAALKGKPVRLAKIEPTRKTVASGAGGAALSLDHLAQLQPDDIFRRLYEERYGETPPPEQMTAFTELAVPGADE